VYGVIKDNPERFGMDQEMTQFMGHDMTQRLESNVKNYEVQHRIDRESIFYCSKEIGDFQIYMYDYGYNTNEIAFVSESTPAGEGIDELIGSKFPCRKQTVCYPSLQYSQTLHYIGEHIDTGESIESPVILMQEFKEDNRRAYIVHMSIKCNLVTGILDSREFENIARALGTKFAYAVSYAFCKKVREMVRAYNHDIDEHNKTLDENVTKEDKISLDFPRLRQRTRGAIKLSVPPKSLQEAAARVLATEQYDYSADTEENQKTVPVNLRAYIGNLRSDHMEYVLPRQAT